MSFWVDLQTVGAAWASAIATASATATALWLALSDRRQRDADRLLAARIRASGIAVYLEELRLELNTALASISEAQRRGTADDLKQFLDLVSTNVQSLNTDFFSPEETSALSALPDSAAEKTYVAIACIRSVQGGLKRRLEVVSGGHPESNVLVNYWKNQLSWALALITEAQSVCAECGQIRIIRPKS
ncbi:hypothetical protein ACRS2S_19910 [Achromobacter xylosoxidans]|uniref:hypothetical protein n=1 Tax=Alcaligenes xylosoxydans xylosoxydans TaxID=85698 RepID=UPI003EE422A8